ncbi:MAG: hypothetical protein LBO74_16330 [Candidatus Symbiothrix sp.]|jgi:hypothetical protein|nr:hypothetical protein [Candidatus Symbiothrix sp.]
MKKYLLLFMAMSICPVLFAQYRVKKITLTEDEKSPEETVFNYTNNLLSSITTNGKEYTTKDVEKKLSFQRDKKDVYLKVEINKKGEVEEYDDVKLKYQKDGKLKSLLYTEKLNKIKRDFDLYYNEENKLAAAVRDEKEANRNYLLYYTDGYCTKVEEGFGDEEKNSEVIIAEWDNGLLSKLTGYTNRNRYITHEFYYDDNKQLSEEKIYEGKGEEKKLARSYKLEYEPGAGNEKVAYFSYNNWKVSLFFNQITCDMYAYVYY